MAGRFAGIGLTARNFRCFGDKPEGFAEILPLNLVIGRNNTGKSALLDLVRHAVEGGEVDRYAHKHKVLPTVLLSAVLDEETIERAFSDTTSGGPIPGNHRAFGMKLLGKKASFELVFRRPGPAKKDPVTVSLIDADYPPGAQSVVNKIANVMPNPFFGLPFARISAERDVVPEPDSSELGLGQDGRGATNIVQRILHDEQQPSELVERELLEALNQVMGPDAQFTRVAAQRTADDLWTIYLDEAGKGRISLVDSGSGLKTIFLVLINMLVMPMIQGKDPSSYLFAFEELENNLHPGLQRRLFSFVHEKLRSLGATAFITTHSPVIIDTFGGTADTQIVHVTHDGEVASAAKIQGTRGGHSILDDLDVRASDLLQANGVVWVEGISDSILLRRWIELYCAANGMVCPAEGSEYTFLEYGGRCLSHFDFGLLTREEMLAADAEWLIPALAVSRNSFVVMDSDKRGGMSKVNASKLKVAGVAQHYWITAGREIENYLTLEVAEACFGAGLHQYGSAAEVYAANHGGRLDKKKAALFAVSVLTDGNWHCLDLYERIEELVGSIRLWNPNHSAVAKLAGPVDPAI